MSMEDKARRMLSTWLRAVCKGTPEQVVNLYATNGILIGTVAESIKQGRPAIKTYFDMFMAKDKLCGEVDSLEVQMITPTTGIASGTYTFKWEEDGKPVEVEARFSYVFAERPSGKIEILNHHSSAQPESKVDLDGELSDLF
jgi:uncharacterized protein (TIGR02246 family)